MPDFSLIAKFGMDASGVKSELKQLRSETNDFVQEWGKLGLAAGAAAFVALSKGAVDLAGSLADASANIGINVISLQALEAQHKRNGVSNEGLVKGLEKVKALSVAAAEGDDKAASALEKLGIKTKDFIALPLDKQYEAIAKSVANSKNETEAYSAVSDIFGAKIGPKMMGSLKELGEIGLPGVTKSARDAGQVMEANVIVALDRAGDAIDDFKKKATIAVGNILINFSSEEGLKLLLFQLLALAGKFVGTIMDGIVDTGNFFKATFTAIFQSVSNYFNDALVGIVEKIATALNKVLPSNFEINIGNLEKLKSSGEDFVNLFARAITDTSPSTFKKDIGDTWGGIVKDQQKVVDALNNTKFGKDAAALTAAGDHVADKLDQSGKSFANSVEAALNGFFGSLDKASTTMKDGGKEAGQSIEDAANEAAITMGKAADDLYHSMVEAASKMKATLESVTIGRTGSDYSDQSTTSLLGVKDKLNKQLNSVGSQGELIKDANMNTNYGDWLSAQALKAELDGVNKELAARNKFQSVYNTQGANAALRQYGDSDYQRFTQDITSDTKKTAQSLTTLVNGLQSKGILPR